jgi:hypothetical protein
MGGSRQRASRGGRKPSYGDYRRLSIDCAQQPPLVITLVERLDGLVSIELDSGRRSRRAS